MNQSFRTANTLEDLDICDELNTYESVGFAAGRHAFWSVDKKYHDVDIYIIMMDNSEEKEIRQLLNNCLMTAWLEYDDSMVKID